MISKETAIIEGTNFRSLFLKNSLNSSLKSLRNFSKIPIQNKILTGDTDCCLAHINIQSNEPPPKNYRNRVKEISAGIWEYRVYLLDIRLPKLEGLLISTPIENIFSKLVFPKPINYIASDLSKICDDQFKRPTNQDISITRLNIETNSEKDNKVNSAAIYGSDILSSILIRDLIFQRIDQNNTSYKNTISSILDSKPFTAPFKNQHQIRSTLPTSCRLKYDNGKTKPIGLNTDRFGNYSFFIAYSDDFFSIIEFFKYLSNIKALLTEIKIDPLKRSKESLKEN